MKPAAIVRADRFHGYLDTERGGQAGVAGATTQTKHLIVQERDVAYRFHLHEHPYVQQLMQRLVHKGTAGLQAADTECASGATSLPGSLDIVLPTQMSLTIATGSKIALLGTVQATAGGGPVELAAHMAFDLAGAAPTTLLQDVEATLMDGMTDTPAAGALFEPGANGKAQVAGDTHIVLAAASTITLHDGTPATLPAGTDVLLAGGSKLEIPPGAQVKLLRSRMRPLLFSEFFDDAYLPGAALVQHPYPVKDLDFSSAGAYSAYNWELFFHVPLTIGMHLSKNQRFAEAQRWFHYLFDPTDDSEGPTPQRYWKVRPFQTTDVQKIEALLVNLATGADETLRAETVRSMEAWKNAPFRPHVIARYRQQAYMYKTVMAYLDNLIAWGDSLFRQDTGEAIDESMMVYVLAANILGPRPLPVPRKGTVRPQTYANLRQDLRQFGTAMRDVEEDLPFDLMPFPAADAADNESMATLRSLGKALYFCVPRNDKLLAYWDTVADRLFKIRNSLNFQGVFRQLALFEPPIDPALLARAAAAGLDVGVIVSGINQPLPLVRFQLLVQKAAEICQEVKSLGNSLLAAMEKEDGEAMAILRARHERAVMEMVEHVRYGQLQDAIKSREGLLQTLGLAVQRYTYYERQLGKKAEEIEAGIPELEALDQDSLNRMRFAMQEPQLRLRDIEVDIAQDLGSAGGAKMSVREVDEMDELEAARSAQNKAAWTHRAGALLAYIPDIQTNIQPFGTGASLVFGGAYLSNAERLVASFWESSADSHTYQGGRSARIGSYARREQEWAYQSNLAAGEVSQIFKQIRCAEIRQAIAEMELKNHRQQMKQAEEIERFLNEEGTESKGKKTNKALYAWMKREVRGLYNQCFQFAFDVARKAERALQHELGNLELSYLQYGYLAGKEGLLAGEKLYFDIKRMEMAYHDLNQREYELTRHVSLLQVNPMALLQLRETGRCAVTLPETLFDMDGPGHYFRRIKTVSVSIPCVTGPYASVNCTLTLLRSSIRKTPTLDGVDYERQAEDSRFTDYYGSLQAIVTSSAQNDGGLFEANLRDDRYLPFENSGVLSEWQLELPANPSRGDPRAFDYKTISDVILHIRYTARDGGGLLRKAAVDHVSASIAAAKAAGSVRLFSLRDEFPSEWAKFQGQTPGANQRFELAFNLRAEHYPFWSQGHLIRVLSVDFIVRIDRDAIPGTLDIFEKADRSDPSKSASLTKDAALGNLLVGGLAQTALPSSPVTPMRLYFEDKQLGDVWVAVTWGK